VRDPHVLFSEVANEFGLSRERVRQIAARYMDSTAEDRRPAKIKTRPPLRPGQVLIKRVNEWLKLIDAWYCWRCHRVFGRPEMKNGRCVQCNRDAVAEWLKTQNGKEPDPPEAK
jgi:hypothetical protein